MTNDVPDEQAEKPGPVGDGGQAAPEGMRPFDLMQSYWSTRVTDDMVNLCEIAARLKLVSKGSSDERLAELSVKLDELVDSIGDTGTIKFMLNGLRNGIRKRAQPTNQPPTPESV